MQLSSEIVVMVLKVLMQQTAKKFDTNDCWFHRHEMGLARIFATYSDGLLTGNRVGLRNLYCS